MTCPACLSAERHPTSDEFTAGCDSCQARAIACTGGHLLEPAAYGKLLFKLFNTKHREGEAMVRKWAAKIKQARAREGK